MESIFVFLKERIFDFGRFFDWNYLTISPSVSIRYFWVYIGIFAFLILCGIALAIYLSRSVKPKFLKKYLYWVESFLLYIPFFLILHLLIRLAGIEPLNTRLTALALLAIWLIWFIFLLYYLIVIIPKYFRLYVEEKRREKYIRDGSKK